jgi:hypothetical protein
LRASTTSSTASTGVVAALNANAGVEGRLSAIEEQLGAISRELAAIHQALARHGPARAARASWTPRHSTTMSARRRAPWRSSAVWPSPR